MTLITGQVADVGMNNASGVFYARATEFRGDGTTVVSPSPATFTITGGVVSAEVEPGPTIITLHVGPVRKDWFVNVPESDVGLGDLIEAFTEYEPPVVSAAIAARDAAEQARDEAVAAAGDVDSAIAGAAGAVVAAVESDRVAAEAAAGAASGSASAAGVSAGDASAAAGAAAQSASDAAGSASDAAAARSDVRRIRDTEVFPARDAAAGSAAAAAGSAESAGSARDAAVAAQSGAESARDAADGHADRAEAAANEFGLTASSSTLAPGAAATVTVSGDGPAYSLAFGVPQGPKGDKGDEGEISQAQLDAAVASLVANAPEALNTLSELSTALGDDPNFATTVSTQIGERAKTSDVNAALAGKADVGAEDTAKWGQVSDKPSTFTPTAHTHPVSDVGGLQAALDGKAATSHTHTTAQVTGLDSALDGKAATSHAHPVTDLTATGTRSASTYLRGDGSWATPPDTNTTYSVPTQAEAEAGTATTARAFSAQRVRQAIDARAVTREGSTQGLWIGTTANLPATGTAGVLYVTYE